MAERLEVHIAGGGIGESIVLGLPNGKWGVVDSYVPSSTDPMSSPSFRLLKKRGITALEFVCLTHPDSDHVKGMNFFLEQFTVKRFWVFGAKSPSDLYQQIATLLKIKAKRLNDPMPLVENADAFVATMRIVKRLREQGKIQYVPITLGLPLYQIPATATSRMLQITALGPSGNLIEQYERSLKSCFDEKDRYRVLEAEVPKVRNNNVSAGLLIEYGDTVITLGGDIVREGWEEVLKFEGAVLRLKSNVVKVSHHGSTNGYCARLWEDHLSPNRCAVGVVTTYSPKRLPRQEGIAHIKKNTNALYTTSGSAVSFAKVRPSAARRSAFRKLSPEAVTALEATFSAAHIVSKSPQGICSFTFDDAGQFGHQLTGDATPL